MKDASRTVQAIQGTITMMDGSTSEFIIGTDFGWQQWAAVQERLGRSVATIEALVSGLKDEDIPFASDNDEDGEYDEYTHTADTPLNLEVGEVIDIDGERYVYFPHWHLGTTWCEVLDEASGVGVSMGWLLENYDFNATGEKALPASWWVLELGVIDTPDTTSRTFAVEVGPFLDQGAAFERANSLRGSSVASILIMEGTEATADVPDSLPIVGASVVAYSDEFGTDDSTRLHIY